jgi:hypothetical protein
MSVKQIGKSSIMGKSGKKYPFILLVVLICLLPSLILAEWRATNPYVNTIISHVMSAFDDGRLIPVEQGGVIISDPYQHGHIGYQSILLTIIKVCQVSPKYVQFLPLGGLFVPFLCFVLFRKILGSDALASLFAVYIAYEPMLSKGHFNVQAYAWARILFLTFLVLCVRILNKRTTENILLLLIIFVGTFLIYWTTPVWMLTLWAFISVIPILQTRLAGRTRGSEKQSISLALVFIVIYMAFSGILYQYLPAVAEAVYGGPEEGWTLFTWQIRELFGGAREPGPYEYAGATLTNPLLGWLLFTRYVVLLAPHVAYMLSRLKAVVQSRSLNSIIQDQADLLIWGGLLVVIVHTGSYALRGHMSFRPVLLLFPITGIISINQLKLSKVVRLIFPLMLAFLSVFGFFLHYQEIPSYSVESSAQWLLDRSEEATALTDLYIANNHLLEQLERARWLTMDLYDPIAYRFLVEGEQALMADQNAEHRWDYVIIDISRLQQPVLSGGWKVYEPLSNHFQEILDNTNLNVVYDEGRFLILQTSISPQ